MTIDELLVRWAAVRAGLLATAGKFTEADLDYVPVAGGNSVAQLLLHIAHEEEGEIRYGITRELAEWPPAFTHTEYPILERILAALEDTHGRTERWLRTLTDADLERTISAPWGQEYRLADMLWHVLEHEIHHRGELSLILGLLGREGLDA